MTRLHLDLEGLEPHARVRWQGRLDAWRAAGPANVITTASPEEADAILVLGRTRPWGRLRGPGLDTVFPDKTFAWDSGDFPSGRLPGLYAGLPAGLHERARHRTFCYPFRWNPLVTRFDPADATSLAGFRGDITSPLRSRLVAALAGRSGFEIAVTESLWTRMDDPASLGAKRTYADNLRSCRFILCPRGNGVSSVRLFETLEAGRVPVVLSDRFVPPADPAWRDCVIVVPEARVALLPDLLREADADWPALAKRARAYWEKNYADENLLASVAGLLGELLERPRRPGWGHRARLLRFAARQTSRDAARAIRRLLP